eukprot:tig00001537_g9308.t1
MQGPNEEAWGLLAGLYAARGMAPELAALRARMRERCARPGARFFRLLLAGHAEAGDEAAVAAARAEMAAAGLPEGPETFHVLPLPALQPAPADLSIFPRRRSWPATRRAPAACPALCRPAPPHARPRSLPQGRRRPTGAGRQVREEMRGAGHEVEGAAFAALIGGAARAGDVEEALALRAEMTALGVPESTRTLTPLVEALLAAGRVAPAANLVRGAPDAAVDGFLYGRLLRAALARGSRALAAELEEEAAARGFGDAEAATAAARAGDLARRGDPEAAERALAQAAARGARLPALPFNTLLDACAPPPAARPARRRRRRRRGRQVREAGDAAGAERAAGLLERAGARPDAATMNGLVEAHSRAGDLDAALAALRRLQRRGPPRLSPAPALLPAPSPHPLRENAYTSLVEALCRCGRHAEARAVAARLRAGAAERGAPPGAKLRRTLVSWLLRDGLAGEAEEELQAAREDGLGGDESLAALARMARMDGRPRP